MKKATDLEIIEEIYKRRGEIISNISSESASVYLWLKDEYSKGNIKNNSVFRFVFRSYYGLDSAGLSDKQKTEYFALMANGETDLETILNELYKWPTLRNKNSIQFSFATKLIHTIDTSKPIFDTEVSAVIHKAVTGNSKETKIESAKNIYAYLENLYLMLVENPKIKEVMKESRSKFSAGTKKITDEKVLDFLVWSLGKLKRKKSKEYLKD